MPSRAADQKLYRDAGDFFVCRHDHVKILHDAVQVEISEALLAMMKEVSMPSLARDVCRSRL